MYRETRFFFLLVCLCILSVRGIQADEIEFNRDIRPILSDRCYHCHGPDESTREADLRLDLESEVFKNKDDSIIKPGSVEQSELFQRIVHSDPDLRMPPPESERQLTKVEIDKIKKWIQQGAKWQKHWSFIRPSKSLQPVVDPSWEVNEIDRFILGKLKQVGLKHSPIADKRRLIRRVTLDLTGLPPTPKEIKDFVDDRSKNAYEKLVDRLLASPHYGERMSQFWLDASRYADSHGYSLDRRRVMWPWRDWVIQAYNQNMPFDEFAIEQLAGDLLPNASVWQRVATGFNRNHPIQSEGGVINEEYRIETVVDRVETTSAVFLGLTMGCCRCHDHKYEPISQKEFYQFFAFFNNVPETAHVGNADNQADRPFLKAPSPLQAVREEELAKRIQELAAQPDSRPAKKGKTVERTWIEDKLPAGAQPFGNGGGQPKFVFVAKGKGQEVYSGQKSSVRESKGLGQHGFTGATDRLMIRPGAKLFTWVYLDPKNPPREIMLQWNDGSSWEHRAIWGEDLIAWGKKETTSRKHFGTLPMKGKWIKLEVAAEAVGLVGKSVSGWAFTQFDGKVFWDKAGVIESELSDKEKRLNQLRQELASLRSNSPTVMVMAEMKPARKTFVLNRGQYDAPTKQQVLPGIPNVLGELESGQTKNRLSLAKWLFSKKNPLTARVTVNRYWQMYFGSGLVSTAEDFGTQGSPPSHPELLDWLACEFRDSGWNVKELQKKIVMSATYKQSSRITPEQFSKDPSNRWLARGPSYRLTAESIRDQALAVSGLLVKKIGGPSVRPYQPPGLWKDVVYSNVPKFKQDHGKDLYRRSLYTYWKRSVPPPNLQTLDAPSRESCTLKRSRTNTPQATLVIWNDPTFVEAARVLAEKVCRRDLSDRESLRWMFELTTCRSPDEKELDRMISAYQYLNAQFKNDPEAATEFLATGEYPRDKKLDPIRVASLGAVANGLFALDEVLTKN